MDAIDGVLVIQAERMYLGLADEQDEEHFHEHLRQAVARCREEGVSPLAAVACDSMVMLFSKDALADADPMLARLVERHLGGEWAITFSPPGAGRARHDQIEERDRHVLAALPVRWGEHRHKAASLDLSIRQWQRALNRLLDAGEIAPAGHGCYVRASRDEMPVV